MSPALAFLPTVRVYQYLSCRLFFVILYSRRFVLLHSGPVLFYSSNSEKSIDFNLNQRVRLLAYLSAPFAAVLLLRFLHNSTPCILMLVAPS